MLTINNIEVVYELGQIIEVKLTEAVALARVLGTAPAELLVFAVEGACFEHGAGLSREVAEAAYVVAERIAAEIEAAGDWVD